MQSANWALPNLEIDLLGLISESNCREEFNLLDFRLFFGLLGIPPASCPAEMDFLLKDLAAWKAL